MRMRLMFGVLLLCGCCAAEMATTVRWSATAFQSQARRKPLALRANSLCLMDEHIIFSCAVKRTGKIISLCASKDLAKERGYLQYRFGLPGRVELEFPKSRTGTQQQFRYSHYFRAQVDLTEISFSINGYQYQVTDDYNGEEKPAQTVQGVSVTAPGKPKEVSFVCRTKPKTDYGDLQAVLPSGQE